MKDIVHTTQQRTIGLIGGMSWQSSAEYYRLINQHVHDRLGGVHSARCLLWSCDFGEIEALQHAGQWDTLTLRMVDAAQRLYQGGADFLLLCTNTMHYAADALEQQIKIPLLHIVDPTAERIKAAGLTRIGLLGTSFTMERDFYKGRLTNHFDLEVVIPDARDREIIHNTIYDELVRGITRDASREAYQRIIERLIHKGAQAIILGCTEIMLLIQQEHSSVPLFDTTAIHAEAAVDWALAPSL